MARGDRRLIGPEHPDHGSGNWIFLYWRDFMGIALMLDAEPQKKAEAAAASPDIVASYAKHADEIAPIEEIRRGLGATAALA